MQRRSRTAQFKIFGYALRNGYRVVECLADVFKLDNRVRVAHSSLLIKWFYQKLGGVDIHSSFAMVLPALEMV